MLNPPKTPKEALAYRYGQWAGNPDGTEYNTSLCAYEVFRGRAIGSQCSRKNGYGSNGLYCLQHRRIVER